VTRTKFHAGLTGLALVALVFAIAGCGDTKTVERTIVTQQAPPPTAAPSTTPSSQPSAPAPSSSTPTLSKVPNLVGERLDVAESKLNDLGITYTEVGGGVVGIVVRSNWTVCKTDPSEGKKASGPVKLIVARSC
jgi:hypothetical protein